METLSNFIILQRRKLNIKTKFINQIPNYSNTGEIKIKRTVTRLWQNQKALFPKAALMVEILFLIIKQKLY